jgi:predicted RNA polymerase sigma factor
MGFSLTNSSRPVDVATAVTLAFRQEWAFVLAATVRVTGDIDVAEECVQDAFARAMDAWALTGIPRGLVPGSPPSLGDALSMS